MEMTFPDEPKIDGTMGIIYNGEGEMNTTSDPFNHYDGNIGIELRGNSTQGFDKLTYAVELRTAANTGYLSQPFRHGRRRRLDLFMLWLFDKSQLRIPFSFYLAQRMGHYASDWRYVEVIINDEYQGLYILTERIKRDDDRVDIERMDEDDVSGDAVTGGYILRIDWLEGDGGFESEYESQSGDPMTFQWYYPREDRIAPEQEDYIIDWMETFEDAVFSPSYTNTEGKRYTQYIDVNSFVDFLIINELSKNSDGYKLSSYVHKDVDSKGGKLVAGPIWDFDQTYGVSEVCSCSDPTGFTYLQNQDGCEDLESMPMWWQAMMQDSLFRNRLDCRWTEFRESFLHLDSINLWIDTYVDLLEEPLDRNYTQWDEYIGEYIWFEPEPVPESYDEEITYLKDWIQNRIAWLDDNFPGNCENDLLSSNH